jgi:hypothetical protein
MPLAMSEVQPDPLAPSTRTGRILAPGATADTPVAFPVSAAIVPATCVPWPFGSVLVPSVPATKSLPGSTCPARSGWLASTPVSTTATVTPEPVDFAQASATWILEKSHCWVR